MYRYTSPEEFHNLTYSKYTHFKLFDLEKYDYLLYGKKSDPVKCDLKVYQDLLVFSFLMHNIPQGGKILQVGNSDARILEYFKNRYECWNLNENSNLETDKKSYRSVKGSIGNFNNELKDNYFDLVFSVSSLSNITINDPVHFKKIVDDINRILKAGSFSLHCFDIVLLYSVIWTNDLLPYMFDNQKTLNTFVPFDEMKADTDLFVMSEYAYNKNWKKNVKEPYAGFKPLSYNVLWKKEGN